MTEYHLLKYDEGGAWVQVGTSTGASADAAIRAALKGEGDLSGTYVAVPARSWKPVTVEAVQTTVLKLS